MQFSDDPILNYRRPSDVLLAFGIAFCACLPTIEPTTHDSQAFKCWRPWLEGHAPCALFGPVSPDLAPNILGAASRWIASPVWLACIFAEIPHGCSGGLLALRAHRMHTVRAPHNVLEQTTAKRSFLDSLVPRSSMLTPPPLCISYAKVPNNTAPTLLQLGQGRRPPGTKREDCMVSWCRKGEYNAQMSPKSELCGFEWGDTHKKCVHDPM